MRLPDLTPAELTDDQHAVYDRITSGPRATGPQHFPLVHASGALTGPFGVMVHEPALGLGDDELGALAGQVFTSSDPVEAAAYELCRRLLDGRSRLTDAEYADLVEDLGTSTLTELVVLVGYYRTLAQLLDVFDVGAPGPQ